MSASNQHSTHAEKILEACHYLCGFDVAGWEGHMRNDEVAGVISDALDGLEEQLEAAREVIAGQDDLLVAYRLGDQPRADKALTRLAVARASFPASSPQTHERDCHCASCREASLPASEPKEKA